MALKLLKKKAKKNPTELNICGVLKYLFSRIKPGLLGQNLTELGVVHNP
jgi:hypothetical protein